MLGSDRLHRRLLCDARLQPKVVKTQYDQCELSVVMVMRCCTIVVAGPLLGLHYETVHRQPGPSDAERKLEELTRQLEVEMRLGTSPSAPSLSPRQRSPVVSGVPLKTGASSLPVTLPRTNHSQHAPSCSEWLVVVTFLLDSDISTSTQPPTLSGTGNE